MAPTERENNRPASTLRDGHRRDRIERRSFFAKAAALGGAALAGTPEASAADPVRSPVVSVKDFGAVGNDSTDDSAAFATAATAAVAAKAALVIPGGTYKLVSKWVLSSAHTGLRVLPLGKVVLHFTGTGTAIELGANNGAVGTLDIHFGTQDNAIWVNGNLNCTNAVHCQSLHHSSVWIKVWNCVTGLRSQWAVCTDYGVTVSSSEIVSALLTPTNGIILDAQTGTPGNYTAACNIYPVIEGVRGTGIVGTTASFNTIYGGTSEGNNKGLTWSSSCRLNKVISTDFEQNKTDDLEDAGTSNSYSNVNFAGGGASASISMTGDGATFTGGYMTRITLDAASTDATFVGVACDSGITFAGSAYKRYGCYTVDNSGVRNGTLSDIQGQIQSVVGPAGLPNIKAVANIVAITGSNTPLFSSAFSGMWIARDGPSGGIAMGTCDPGVPECTTISNTITATVVFSLVSGKVNARTTAGTVKRNLACFAVATSV